ncbi:MAG: DegT/DnrJ/EryC1/StrS family aminotransferase [Acidobacteria bacterium]|nr:DegT/DnrJ/EryC1/StrS family aminotransferase [Acidobacteriota bacterium]
MTPPVTAVPMFDLGRAARRIDEELRRRWDQLLEQTAFVGGDEVSEFERAFADSQTVGSCVAVANGTDALTLALRALGVGPGDEVIVPAFSFIATAEAVSLVGATPVFADVDFESLNLDLKDAASKLSSRSVGIIGVHLYGSPFDIDEALSLCRERGLWLVEDAAQAHGAQWRGRAVGGFGRMATWSFYPSKNLGCFGDGGAVTTNEPELAERVRRLANHGVTGRYHHAVVGTNSRLDALQAAVLNCRLPRLAADNARRGRIAERYRRYLAEVPEVVALPEPQNSVSAWHQFTVLSPRRDALQAFLAQRGIGSATHYPEPLHRQPAFADLGEPPLLPAAERAAAEVLCLPMFAELTDPEVDRVGQALLAFAG